LITKIHFYLKKYKTISLIALLSIHGLAFRCIELIFVHVADSSAYSVVHLNDEQNVNFPDWYTIYALFFLFLIISCSHCLKHAGLLVLKPFICTISTKKNRHFIALN
jgi:hypothetical protein